MEEVGQKWQERLAQHAQMASDFAVHSYRCGQILAKMNSDSDPKVDTYAMLSGAFSNIALANAAAFDVVREMIAAMEEEVPHGTE